MAILASKYFTVAKKLLPVGFNLIITDQEIITTVTNTNPICFI